MWLCGSENLGQSAAGHERGVAVGNQGGDEDLAVHLAELQDLQSARHQPSIGVGLVVGERGLPAVI